MNIEKSICTHTTQYYNLYVSAVHLSLEKKKKTNVSRLLILYNYPHMQYRNHRSLNFLWMKLLVYIKHIFVRDIYVEMKSCSRWKITSETNISGKSELEIDAPNLKNCTNKNA